MTVINENYQKILASKSGAQFFKADLHVHTPASGDAQAKNKYNFKYDIANIPKSKERARELAAKIVDAAIKKGLRLIAITDHNTPSNTHPEDLTNTWYQLIRNAARGKDLCVLPGVEISTDDLHVLVILDPKEDEPAAYMTHRINFLLKDCKFTLDDYGDYRATGMSSLFDVMHYIEELGTECIAIPAHIDGGKKAMLSVYKEPSNVFNKLLNHSNLNAVEVVKETTPSKKKLGGKRGKIVQEYFDKMRDEDRSPLAYIQNSDGHSISEIGKRFSYIKMGEPSFWSLKNALEDPETRIRMPGSFSETTETTRILGIAFRRQGGTWNHVAFNPNLNCIIGKKKTQKSAIIDIIMYGLDRFEGAGNGSGPADEEKDLIKHKYQVNVFIGKNNNTYCYSRKGAGKPETFTLNNGSFTKFAGTPQLELPRKYNHEIIEERFAKKIGLMDFLDRHIFANKKINSLLDRRNTLLGALEAKKFGTNDPKMKKLRKTCKSLYDERKRVLDTSLSLYGKDVFRVKVAKGKWSTGTKKEDFYDKASMTVRVRSRHRSLNTLNTGEKNAIIMVLLMNEDAFGPLIIDEPEQQLDVASIVSILVPRIRKLKTQQQIICVTKDEHIILSGDAEQVIATQSEKDVEVVTGDVMNRDMQHQILEIFEGSRGAMEDKTRKIRSILE
ncbi:MAG: hypothetical protein JSV33_01730 [bacterium]|nr:MAG: hypothetical protein JSV33_01730 [bacterium]